MRIFQSLIVLATASLLAGCGRSSHRSETEPRAAAMPVQTVSVVFAEWRLTHEAVGTVRARTSAAISSKVMSYVREVRICAGDRVQRSQLLVVLDSSDLEAGYGQAEAALQEARNALPEADNAVNAARSGLELAEVTFRRMDKLFERKSLSNQEFDEASARLNVARSQLEMAISKRSQLAAKIQQAEQALRSAEIQHGYAQIAAPFSGRVTDRTVEPGTLATPGARLLTLEQEGTYRLEVSLEESRLPQIRSGQSATVVLDSLELTLEARVSELVPTVDAASSAFLVKLDLPSRPHLRSGLFGRARFALGRRQVLVVPQAAVVEQGQLQSVLVVTEGRASARLVTLGEQSGGQVEVLSGLKPGEKVISPLSPGLVDGARVEVRP